MSSGKITRNKTGICIIFIILYISFFSLNATTIPVNTKPLEGYIDVTVTEAYNLIKNTTNLFILDVRTEDEYDAGHINNSYLLPYDEIITNQDKLPLNKSHPILVYCRSGIRSAIASNTLVELNYTQIYNLEKGYILWELYEFFNTSSSDDTSTDSSPFVEIISIIIFVLIFILFMIIRMILLKGKLKRRVKRRFQP